jgi:molybdopterin-guanine dinucleotide biosynthesis protein A
LRISALVLSGGQGLRMGGADKGLQLLDGQPLAARALARLRQQSWPPAALMISANRHLDEYRALGVPVWPDAAPPASFAGPLAGVLTGLRQCATPWLLTVPCDAPFFPLSLCERLARALLQAQPPDRLAAVAWAPGAGQPDAAAAPIQQQPAFSLLAAQLADDLARYLQAGGRKMGHWLARQQPLAVPFTAPQEVRAFANINTLAELRALQQTANP